MSSQHPAVFNDFALTAFPRLFGLNKHRVSVFWTAYAVGELGKNPAFDSAIYCVDSAFMGRSHNDTKLQESTWEIYSRALGHVKSIFGNRKALQSRESLSAAMLLCVFEAYSRTDKDAWAKHASGAGLIMSLRGPNYHLAGFDRTLYLSFRSFLVGQAFIQGTPCLFEKPEWQALANQIREEDMADLRAGRPVSTIIDLSDRFFMEVVKVPGFISRAREISSSPVQDTIGLIGSIANCTEAVQALSSSICLAVTTQQCGPLPPDTHPSPKTILHKFAIGLLKPVESCLRILGLLLHHLTHEQTSLSSQNTTTPLTSATLAVISRSSSTTEDFMLTNPSKRTTDLPFRIVSNIHVNDETVGSPESSGKLSPADRWLDQVTSSMGMDAFEIVSSERC